MRDGASDEVLAGACTWQATVTSWLGGRLLAERVPLSSGRVSGAVDDDIIETLTLTVPRFAAPESGADVIDWRPSSPDHPLARYGQILDITITVSSVITGEVWETRIGRYQIKDWSDDDAGLITVKGESLLARPRDDKLKVLSSPTGTFASEARRLLPAGMGASIDPTLVDRAVPTSMSWAKDRLKNLQEIAAAWPALLRIDPWGQVAFRAPLPSVPSPVLTLRDGRGGTLISAPRSDTRSGVFNEVIASTTNTDKEDVQDSAGVTAGPMSINGEYGVVTKEWSSPLIENKAQAAAAASTMLSNSTRPALAIPARIAPDPRIELDDAVAVLRGARGHMVTVDAAYSEWEEQRRNYVQDPRFTLGSARWGITSGSFIVTGDAIDATFTAAATSNALTPTPTTSWWGSWTAGDLMSAGYLVKNIGLISAIMRIAAWNNVVYTYGPAITIAPGEEALVSAEGLVTPAGGTYMQPRLHFAPGSPTGERHLLISEPIAEKSATLGPAFDGGSNPSGLVERTRWTGDADASPSVLETRRLVTPEHRLWVVESVEESVDVDRQWGWVTAYDLPLTVSDGDMRVDVGLPS